MQYQTVAEAYRDLEQASGRLALVDRLATLLAQTPAGLLPVVCYLCQGLIAPEFAGVDLGLAEKLAVRAVATATGVDAAQVTALICARPGISGWPPSSCSPPPRPTGRRACRSPPWSTPCTRSPRPRDRGRRAASWTCWPGCSARPPRWRPATCCAWSPRGCGWASARPPSWTRWPRSTPAGGPPGRCWSAPTTSAVTWAGSPPPWPKAAWRRPSRSRSARATRCGPCWPSGSSEADRDPGQARRAVRGGVQVRRRPGAGAPHRGRGDRAVHPAAGTRVRAVPRRR